MGEFCLSMQNEKGGTAGMSEQVSDKKQKKLEGKKLRKQLKRQKKNAVVVCRDNSQFWTTQKQFWQWVREGKIVKTSDGPLAGQFVNENEEKYIVLANTVLNMSCPNHIREALAQRKLVQLR